MIKFMDEIVEVVEEFARAGAECMVFIFGALGKWLIIITVPAWILPYKAIRGALERRANWELNERQEKEDAGNND